MSMLAQASPWTMASVVIAALALSAGWLLRALDWWRTRTATQVAEAVATAKHDVQLVAIETRVGAVETGLKTGLADVSDAIEKLGGAINAQSLAITAQVSACDARMETNGCTASTSRVHLVKGD
jgi:hypothetical protein